jgi:hypothetical protein
LGNQINSKAAELQNKAQDTANAVAETELADEELENAAGGFSFKDNFQRPERLPDGSIKILY